MPLADKFTTGRYNFESLIVKIMLLESILLVLSVTGADKTLSFN